MVVPTIPLKEAKMVEQRSAKRTEPWQITVGGSVWLAGFGGHTEFHGVNPYVKVGFEQILNHINVISSLAGEVRKGLWRPGSEYTVGFVPKVKFEIVISDNRVRKAVKAIVEAARTGKIGDGKVFILVIEECIRIRTAERGEAAI